MSSGAQPTGRRNEQRQRQRSRSRTPPRRTHDSLLTEQLKLTQNSNANDAYFAKLTDYARKPDDYIPIFSYVDGSKRPTRIRGKQWDDTMFEMSVDLYDEDILFFQSPATTASDLEQHLSYMIGDGRRKTEVNIRHLNAEERRQMEEAKDKEVDQWISNSVFKIVRRAGVPLKRSMSMRWILTWKQAPEGAKAKA